MTTYRDYQVNPADNTSPPPVGAPEGMFPHAVNDIMREMMSVIRQLGDTVSTTFAGLGTMAQQNAWAVAITGGSVTATLAGPGGGIWGLNAAALVGGPVPAATMWGYYNISVGWAQNCATLSGMPVNSIVPVGAVIAFYGNPGTLDGNHWAVCDGTRGTPDLRDRYVRGVGPGTGFGAFGSYSTQTDNQGYHNHTGWVAQTSLSVGQLPPHTHHLRLLGGAAANGSGGPWQTGAGNSDWDTESTGSGEGHTHFVYGDGDHRHNVALPPPPSFGLYWIMRIA